ncbi:MAG TPA: MmgE/PrpD family protein [Caulobacteraceae bacterium]|nr:MmgE/PrpD family protein [Caulobacteraceae bacterium]
MTSVSILLAEHVARSRFEVLPGSAIAAAKTSILDAIGVSLAAGGLGEGCAAFIDLASESGPGPSTVLGAGFKAQPLMAALANGAMAHALDYEDAYDGAPIHPNAAVVPAALALAEARDATGKQLIAAVAVGADLVCRLGLCLTENPDRYGWYPPPILGAFGAAAACANLLGLTAAQTLDAFALTLSQATSSSQFKQSPLSHVRAVRDAFAAHAGLLAAVLASKGVLGFAEPFEGKAGLFQLYARGAYDPARLTQDLGLVFEGANVSYKIWPACRGTHAFIQAALELTEQEPIALERIRSIRATGGEIQRMLAEPHAQKAQPKTAIDAKFSIPFTVATALVHGRVDLAAFQPSALSDPAVLSLAGRCRYVCAPASHDSLIDSTGGLLELELTDGRVLSRRIDHPRGHPSDPVGLDELRRKFVDCAGYARTPLASSCAEQGFDAVMSLEHRDVRPVIAGLSI